MTHDSQELLALFGKLLQQPVFASAAFQAAHFGRHPQHQGRGQERLLRLLATRDGISNAEIAEALDIRPSSVSTLVGKLEDSQLIERRPSEDDKRVQLIYLTDDGRKLISTGRELRDDFSEAAFAGLSTQEQQQLSDLLKKLLASMQDDDIMDSTQRSMAEMMRQAQKLHHQFGSYGRQMRAAQREMQRRGGWNGPWGGFGGWNDHDQSKHRDDDDGFDDDEF
jgi:DNA-binding MarR family transcriptional regulator